MCGRTACNLCREEYRNACTYIDKTSRKYIRPEWVDLDNAGCTFQPSNNTCPSDVTPVLVSGKPFEMTSERCIAPMMWGLIPRWHKGEPKKHGLSTSNCRIEGVTDLDSKSSSKLYASPLKNGKRCIVICEGYYEWQTTKDVKNKQPYFIYVKPDENTKVEEASSWKNAEWNEEKGWTGPSLVKMAALYDVWEGGNGDRIHSYSIITMESNTTLSWLHHRMPAILTDENIVQEWLDTDRVSSSRAISLLPSTTDLAWHAVSTKVNNSRNKDDACNKPVELEKETNKKSFSPLKNWLQTGSMKKKSSPSSEAPSNKKQKTEEN